MNSTIQDFICIDYKALAELMASEQFRLEYEEKLPWNELYETVDESGMWFLKHDYQLIFNAIQWEWEEKIMEFDITNTI